MCERSRNRVVQRIREFPRIDYRLNIFDARWTYGHIRLPALVADHRPADPFLSSTQLPLICPGIDRLLSGCLLTLPNRKGEATCRQRREVLFQLVEIGRATDELTLIMRHSY